MRALASILLAAALLAGCGDSATPPRPQQTPPGIGALARDAQKARGALAGSQQDAARASPGDAGQ
ncbi:MAG: hypothetical protein NVSMB51_19960 [Solirubrobacteraceae bacterium]